MANFKNLTNKTQKPQELMKTNRPQSAIKQTRNGGAASFKNLANKAKDIGKIKKATKSGATAPAGGGKFGSFIKQ